MEPKNETKWQWILTGTQAQIVYDALGFWSSDDNDAPHGEIHELRERLVRMGAARRYGNTTSAGNLGAGTGGATGTSTATGSGSPGAEVADIGGKGSTSSSCH